MDLVSTLLKNMTSEDSLSALKGVSGGSDKQVESAVNSAVPTLLKSMTKNASTEDGARSLLGALGQHTSTDPVSSQIKNADALDGKKIIEKIMGGNKDDFIREIAKETGLDLSQTDSLLSNMAPALMSSVSAANSKKDEPSLKSIFGQFLMDDDDRKAVEGFKGDSLLEILKKTIL